MPPSASKKKTWLVLGKPLRKHGHDPRGPQLPNRGQEHLPLRVVLSNDDRTRGFGCVVEKILDLTLDDGRLLLHYQDFAQTLDKRSYASGLDRKAQTHLVETNTGSREVFQGNTETTQRLQEVQMRLAASHDANVAVRSGDDSLVDRVCHGKRSHGLELRLQTTLYGETGQVRPAIVQSSCNWRNGFGRREARRDEIKIYGGPAFDRLRNGFESDPCARETRQRPAVESELQNLRDIGGIDDRHAPRLHRDVALMRHRRRHAPVVVA